MLHRLPVPFILSLNSQRRKKVKLCWKACIHYTILKKSPQYSETVFRMKNKISLRATAITPECWTREKKTQNNSKKPKKTTQPNIKVIWNRIVGGREGIVSEVLFFYFVTLFYCARNFSGKKKWKTFQLDQLPRLQYHSLTSTGVNTEFWQRTTATWMRLPASLVSPQISLTADGKWD